MPAKPRKRHAVVQPQDQSYRLIALTQGQNAIVDTADFDWLNKWSWYAHWHPRMRSFYAWRNGDPDENGKRRTIQMHQFILGCEFADEGDHWNHNTLDNRRDNLRKCSHDENVKNSKRSIKNTSGFKGVSWQRFRSGRGKWKAQIRVGDKPKHLGLFDTPEDAARAHDKAAKELHREFAFLNFP